MASTPVRKRSDRRSPLEAVLRRSADLDSWKAVACATGLWVGLIALDDATGPRFSVIALYLVPLCFTAWCIGSVAGMGSGAVAMLVTLHLDGIGDGFTGFASSVPTATVAWHAGMRAFAVAFIILLVGAFRRTFDRERENAQTDALTGLGNRRSFRHESSRLELSAPRDKRILLCGVIDLDNFKAVNDLYGHSAGDDVLRVVAAALAGAVRPYDATARLGGDEFAFCLAVRDEASAERKTSNIHMSVMAALENCEWTATCSLGAATGMQVDETLTRADEMMFRAKRAGKSSWIFSSMESVRIVGGETA